MQNYSSTQASNIATFAGLVVIVLGKFHTSVSTEEVTTAIGAVLALVGLVKNWYNRYKQGGITLGGYRK